MTLMYVAGAVMLGSAVLALVPVNVCGFSKLAVASNDDYSDCVDGVRCILDSLSPDQLKS